MTPTLIFYQVLLVLAAIPVGWLIGWLYSRRQPKAERGEVRKTSLFATFGLPYLCFVPLLWMWGDGAYALGGFMGLSFFTTVCTARYWEASSR